MSSIPSTLTAGSRALDVATRPDREYTLEPIDRHTTERHLPLLQRIWSQGWLRKTLILAVLAALWEAAARWQNNDLIFPTFLDTAKALVDGLASGELLLRVKLSLFVLLQGYAGGVLGALIFTTMAVSTRLGRDVLETFTAMFNPLPAIAVLPLALLWFGLGTSSIVFVIVHSVLLGGVTQHVYRLPVRQSDPENGRSELRSRWFADGLFHPYSSSLSIHPLRFENRLGLRVAHADRSGAGVRCLGQCRRPRLVHLRGEKRA